MSIFSHWCQQRFLVMKRALRWYLMMKSELLHDYNQIINNFAYKILEEGGW